MQASLYQTPNKGYVIRLTDSETGEIVAILEPSQARRLAYSLMDILQEAKPTLIPEDEIIDTYIAHQGKRGFGLRWVGKKFNVSHMTVKRLLEKHGI